jgi:hypothetical protein
MIILFVFVCIFFAFVAFVFVRWEKKEAVRMLAEFERAFPGYCPICSYARYGRQIGVSNAWPPKEHKCPDEMSRTK